MTKCHDLPAAASATVLPMTEQQLGRRHADKGWRVREIDGRIWVEVVRGFWQGVHPLARDRAATARKPSKLCLGYRVALCEDEASLANATIPTHLLTDVADFGLHTVRRQSRGDLKRFAQGDVEIVNVVKPDILLEQGYDVLTSWASRVKFEATQSREDFLRRIERKVADPHTMVLAGVQDGKLLGYLTVWAVGRTAYLDQIAVATEALPTHLNQALVFEGVQACQRAGTIDEVCPGPHRPELVGVTAWKLHMGFPVVQIPCRLWTMPLVTMYLARRRPHLIYRLTGRTHDRAETQGEG